MEPQPSLPPVGNPLPPGVNEVGLPPAPPQAGTVPAAAPPAGPVNTPPLGTPPPPAHMAAGGGIAKGFFSNTNWVLVFVGAVAVAGVFTVIWYVRRRAHTFTDQQKETTHRIMSLQTQVNEIKQKDPNA